MLLSAPLLTRIYTPEAFGVLAAFVSIVSVIVAVASLRYEMAIPIADTTTAAVRLLCLCLVLVLIAGVASGIAWLVLGAWIATVLGVPVLASAGWVLPIAVVTGGSYQALMLWHVRERGYRPIAVTRVTQAMAGASTQLGLGLMGVGPAGLLAGDVIGRTAGLATLMRTAQTAVRAAGLTMRSLLAAASAHRAFAAWLATAGLLSAAALHAPFLLIPANFGAAAAGTYFLAHRLLVVPVALVGSGAGQVFFGEAARIRGDPDRLRELATHATIALLALGFPVYGGVVVAGPQLFAIVFGAEWAEAGSFAQLLAPSFLLWSIASPLSSMLVVGRREAESVTFTSLELVARVGAISFGAAAGSISTAVGLLAVTGVMLHLAAIWRFLRPAHVRLPLLLKPIIAIVAVNTPGLALLLLTSVGAPSWWTVLVYVVAVGVGLALAAVLLSPVRGLFWRPAP